MYRLITPLITLFDCNHALSKEVNYGECAELTNARADFQVGHLYPVRLNKSAGKFLEPYTIQEIISLEIKLFMLIEIAKPFVGYNIKLVLGTIIFAIPSIISIFFDDRSPKVPVLHRLLASVAFKIVAMVFVGTLAAGFIQGLYSNARTFLAWSFVVLAIPELILSLLGKMAKKPAKDWKITPLGNTAYRILGFLVFLAIFQIVRGVDLYAAVFGKKGLNRLRAKRGSLN
jgi:hypothetical protein